MELVTWVKSLFTTYGGINVLIMVAIIILTNLIKRPILNKANSMVEFGKKHNIDVDKSVITSNIIYIPFGLGLLFYTIYALIVTGFNFIEVQWDMVVANAAIYGAVAQTIYNIGKDKIKAFLSHKSYDEIKKLKAEALELIKDNAVTESAEANVDEEISEAEDDLIISEEEKDIQEIAKIETINEGEKINER